MEGQDGVTIHSKDAETVHVQCMLEEIRQMIGLIDAAAVAVATAISLNLSVEETAQLANAASHDDAHVFWLLIELEERSICSSP